MSTFLSLFPRERYSIRAVQSVAKAEALVIEEQSSFDCFITPLTVAKPILTLIGEIKACPSLVTTPVVALSLERDITSTTRAYEAGVDHILYGPFDLRLLALELSSIARRTTLLTTKDKLLAEESQQLQAFYDTLPLGVAILSPTFELLESNSLFKKIFALTEERHLSPLIQQIRTTVLQAHTEQELPIRDRELTYTTAVGTKTRVRLFADSIHTKGGVLVGYAIGCHEATQYLALAHEREFARRTRRSFALISATLQSEAVRHTFGVSSLSPTQCHKLIKSEQSVAPLLTTLHAVVETLEPLFGNEVTLQITIPQECQVKVRPSDLFMIILSVIHWNIEQSGGPVELTITLHLNAPTARLTIAATAQTLPALAPDPLLQKLCEGATITPRDREHALDLPEDLVARYGGTLSYTTTQGTHRVTHITLPL
jgi:hypothetical protein